MQHNAGSGKRVPEASRAYSACRPIAPRLSYYQVNRRDSHGKHWLSGRSSITESSQSRILGFGNAGTNGYCLYLWVPFGALNRPAGYPVQIMVGCGSLPVMIRVVVVLAAILWSATVYAACGDRGGPGYRGPDGQCVSWYRLARGVCGCPPTTACTPERLHAGAEKLAKLRCKL